MESYNSPSISISQMTGWRAELLSSWTHVQDNQDWRVLSGAWTLAHYAETASSTRVSEHLNHCDRQLVDAPAWPTSWSQQQRHLVGGAEQQEAPLLSFGGREKPGQLQSPQGGGSGAWHGELPTRPEGTGGLGFSLTGQGELRMATLLHKPSQTHCQYLTWPGNKPALGS